MTVKTRTHGATAGEDGPGERAVAAPGLPAPGALPAVPPLLPVLVPLVAAAIVIGALFAWWFPPDGGRAVPAARFTDVTAESGLADWTGAERASSPTTLGGGVVCFDYDGDGRPDLFFVGGAPWPWEEGMAKRASRGSCALFHNAGDGHFTDVTVRAGLNVELQGMTAAAGDFDNDGRPDLFVTCVGANHLFRNRGDGRFEDVTEQAGVGGEEATWSTGAVWLDVDDDGRLDLVVGHYARWPADMELQMAFTVARVGRSYGAPTGFVGAFPTVYRNLGDGRFAPLPGGAGLRDVDPQTGFPVAKTLAVVPVDANADGRIDLLFAYQASETALFLNEGGGRFRRWTTGAEPRPEGIAAGFAAASSLPFATAGDAWLATLRAAADVLPSDDGTLPLPAKFAVAVLDYDLDGRLDVFSARGRAERDAGMVDPGPSLAATPVLAWNRGRSWVETPAEGWARPVVARGVATADFDGDGDPDVVIAQHGGPPQLLRNDQRLGLPWLQVELVAKQGPREGDGARVEVQTPRRVWVQTMMPRMGFMAQSTSTLTFGLGDDARVRKLVVHWPDGTRQEVRPAAVNQRLVITEP